ncbi:MAG TPA: hypothetical protein VIR77_01445 [Pontiella sp.]
MNKRLICSLALLCAVCVRAEIDGDPLYANQVDTNGAAFYAWRPFFSSSVDGERWRQDYLWPLYTRKGFKDEQYGRLLFFGFSNDFSAQDERHRTWLLPVYFQGTSADGHRYLALFPLGGTIHEFLGRDSVRFVLFPLYVRSRINEVDTTSVLWPILSHSTGDKVSRFRIWPLYGQSSLAGEFEKKFILWPIYNSVEYTNQRNPGGGFILFPLFGRITTAQAENYWLLPPFFRYADSEKQKTIHAPWPFIQLADGEKYKRIFWPLYGHKQVGTESRSYYLWPLVWKNDIRYTGYDKHRRHLVPLFSYEANIASHTTIDHAEGDVLERYWKLWPLMSWERQGDQSRFRLLEPWPLRDTPGIERNWAPWWTLYQRIGTGETTGHHWLWGLYRHIRAPDHHEWSLLKGFAGYKNTENCRRFRLLFIWFGDKEDQQ